MKPDPYTELRIITYLVFWFLENFEPIEESTPRDSGEWVFIWGEPVTPLEALDEFSDVFSDEIIKKAAKHLEEKHDVDEWVPKPVQEV
jgi:hypothetical protein